MIKVLKGVEPTKITVEELKDLLGVFTMLIADKLTCENTTFRDFLLSCDDTVFLNVICSGYGGTAFEPECPEPEEIKKAIEDLLCRGFPSSNLMLTISPVIKNQKGIQKVKDLLDFFKDSGVYKIRLTNLIQSSAQKAKMRSEFNKSIHENLGEHQIEELQSMYQNFRFYYCRNEDASCGACIPTDLVQQLQGCYGLFKTDRDCSSLLMSTIQLTKMDENLYYYR